MYPGGNGDGVGGGGYGVPLLGGGYGVPLVGGLSPGVAAGDATFAAVGAVWGRAVVLDAGAGVVVLGELTSHAASSAPPSSSANTARR
jgi:hypothetical protein